MKLVMMMMTTMMMMNMATKQRTISLTKGKKKNYD